MADKQFNITNNSPNYTKNNNINNINYVKRNGAGWSWFKTIFIASMLTIFSVVCFAGGKNAIPQGYTNSIRQESITTLIGYQEKEVNVYETMNNLTINNIHNYVFELINFDNYIPYKKSYGTHVIINASPNVAYALFFNELNINNNINKLLLGKMREDYYTSSGSLGINYSGGGGNVFAYNKNYTTNSFILSSFKYSYPFSFQLLSDSYQYIVDFDLFKNWLINNFTITNLNNVIEPIYVEYSITYATYDWNIKLTQLSKLKNVFTPLFSANIPDEEATLQKGFDQFQEFIDLGVLTYTGDKITPNRKMSENWEYNVNLSSFAKFDEMIHLLTSNLGKYINANYWYDSSTREFVRFDTNTIYGSINDSNTTLKNVINLLSYPITTGFNITYNIGVLFTFIFVW